MAVSVFEGVIENGQIRLRDNVTLPDHATVFVVVPDFAPPPPVHVYSPRLAHPEQFIDFAKEIVEVSADAEL